MIKTRQGPERLIRISAGHQISKVLQGNGRVAVQNWWWIWSGIEKRRIDGDACSDIPELLPKPEMKSLILIWKEVHQGMKMLFLVTDVNFYITYTLLTYMGASRCVVFASGSTSLVEILLNCVSKEVNFLASYIIVLAAAVVLHILIKYCCRSRVYRNKCCFHVLPHTSAHSAPVY